MQMTPEEAERIVQAQWDLDVEAWKAHWVPIFRRFAHDLVVDAGISAGQVVLDVGTGTGVAAFEAARKTKSPGFVFGIDRSKSMVTSATSDASRTGSRQLCFLQMDSRHLYFPDRLFDAVISNCGISLPTLHETVPESFRVLRRGGCFAYSDWHLRDVMAHRIFGEVLQRHRTPTPSRRLRIQRTAFATYERYGNREMSLTAQLKALRSAGFVGIKLKHRIYRIRLGSVYDFLENRFSRTPVRLELRELTARERRALYEELEDNLRQFTRKNSFIFDWKVSFIRARKA